MNQPRDDSTAQTASAEWFENEAFWVELYPFLFHDAAFDVAATEVDKVLQLADVQSGAALDLCSGPGRHAVALARRGFSVTAVDRTAFLLEKARARAAAENVSIEFVHEDMRRFSRPRSFDLAVNLFTSFGYFVRKEDDLKVLRLVRDNLKDDGAFVIDVVSKEFLAKVFQPTASTKRPNGDLLVQRHEVVDDWSAVKNEWTVIRDGAARTFEFQNRIYSGQEIKDILDSAGFGVVRLFGHIDGRPYDRQAERLVAVARR